MELRPGLVMMIAVGATALLIAGCGGGTKTVTQTTEASAPTEEAVDARSGEGVESLGSSGGGATTYPTPAAVGSAIVDDIEARYGEGFESGQCENFAPEAGGAPVYICEIKIGGEWHGNIEATIHPDGTFEWEDLSGSREEFDGGELSVDE